MTILELAIVSVALVGSTTHAFQGDDFHLSTRQRFTSSSRPLHVIHRPLQPLPDRPVTSPTSPNKDFGRRQANNISPTPRNHSQSYQCNAIAFPNSSHQMDDGPSWEEMLALQSYTKPDHPGISRADKTILGLATGFVVTSLFLLLTYSGAGSWRYFMAGGICAAASHSIPTPIDVVKTRKQVDPTLADKSFISATRDIIKKEGMDALWAGLGPTAFGYLLEGAVKFGVYEVLKPVVKTMLGRLATVTSIALLNSKVIGFSLCGMVSGVAASLMVCPMEALRIRMVSEPDFAPNGMLEGGYKMLQREGTSGLAKGLKPMLAKQVPYTVVKNCSFDLLTTFFYSFARLQGIALTAATSFSVPLVAAALASVFATIASQPGDMLLSLVNAHEGEIRTRDVWRNVLRSERGIRGLFVGFKTRLLHVGIVVTLQLLIYDYVKRLCGIAATGSI